MAQSALAKLQDLVAFLFREGGILRSAILPLAIAASLGRTLLIYSVNETAARGGATGWMLPLLLGAVAVTLYASHQARIQSAVLVERLTKAMRRRVADHLLNADVSFFQAREPGRVYSALTGHSVTIAEATKNLVDMIQTLLLLVFCFTYLAIQSWPAVVAALTALALGITAYLLADGPARRLLARANDSRSEFYDAMNDLLRGYKELRLRQAKRAALDARVDRVIEDSRTRTIAAERIFSFCELTATAAISLLLVAIVLILPSTTAADSVTVLQVLTVVLFTFGPIEAVVSSLPGFARASVAYEQMNDMLAELDRNAESEAVRHATDTRPGFQTLELRGITARLDRGGAGDSFTLGPIDLVLHPGESVFITGGNGTGKSTLLQILTGLRHPDGGEILLDGVPVTRDGMGPYRSLFSSVFSEFYLFRQLYGLSDEERARVESHIADLGLSGSVSVEGDRFSSLALSTGQMRRLALSIALAEDRPILVLDEFAADQDPQRRAFFYDVLVPRLAAQGQLVVAVTHDEHCFDKSDRLIRMEDGRITGDSRNARAVTA